MLDSRSFAGGVLPDCIPFSIHVLTREDGRYTWERPYNYGGCKFELGKNRNVLDVGLRVNPKQNDSSRRDDDDKEGKTVDPTYSITKTSFFDLD